MLVNTKDIKKNLKGVPYSQIVDIEGKTQVEMTLSDFCNMYIMAKKNNKQFSVLQLLEKFADKKELKEFFAEFGAFLDDEDKEIFQITLESNEIGIKF